jgi:hypothetical protein
VDGQATAVEQKLAVLARRAHGVVTRRELLRVQITRTEIDHRLRTGALIAVFRGVYRVAHTAPSVEAHHLAAVKACGAAALLSGKAAAHLLGLLKGPAPPPEVSAPGRLRVRAVKTRRGRRQGTLWRGVPVTTPVARRPNSPGAAKLRKVLRGDVNVTLSKLERAFLALPRNERLPLPTTNRRAGGRRVDCRWPDRNLTIELDSYRYHSSRHAWENDRRRERDAYARDDDFRRYTYADVLENSRPMLAELRALLSRAASPPAPTGAEASSAPRSSTSAWKSRSASDAVSKEALSTSGDRAVRSTSTARDQPGTTTQRRRSAIPVAIACPTAETG